MEFMGWNAGVIINPRFRRSAVLRSLYENLAMHREEEATGTQRSHESAGGGNEERPPEEGEDDESTESLRTAESQRNI
ncbi:MAG: hypothetical protein C4536_14870 [Actinobacteria bacterium]|nr:MAG: hypothetical protein C4536_14870 [Actinomycetota bacterium]